MNSTLTDSLRTLSGAGLSPEQSRQRKVQLGLIAGISFLVLVIIIVVVVKFTLSRSIEKPPVKLPAHQTALLQSASLGALLGTLEPYHVDVTINANPPNVVIYRKSDGEMIGKSGTTISLIRSKSPYKVVLAAPGCFNREITIIPQRSETLTPSLDHMASVFPGMKPPAGAPNGTPGIPGKPGQDMPENLSALLELQEKQRQEMMKNMPNPEKMKQEEALAQQKLQAEIEAKQLEEKKKQEEQLALQQQQMEQQKLLMEQLQQQQELLKQQQLELQKLQAQNANAASAALEDDAKTTKKTTKKSSKTDLIDPANSKPKRKLSLSVD